MRVCMYVCMYENDKLEKILRLRFFLHVRMNVHLYFWSITQANNSVTDSINTRQNSNLH